MPKEYNSVVLYKGNIMNDKEKPNNGADLNAGTETPKKKNYRNRVKLIIAVGLIGAISLALIIFSPKTSSAFNGWVLLGSFLFLLNFIPGLAGLLISSIEVINAIRAKDKETIMINVFFTLAFPFLLFILYLLEVIILTSLG